MWNPTTTLELVEAIELAEAAHSREAGERAPPFPRRVVLEQRGWSGAPEAMIKINGRPFKALLDSGSAVSLVQAQILPPRSKTKSRLPITCVHGDTRQVPARRVTISAAPGSWPVEVGIMKDLPVPILLGRDWPGFEALLTAATQPASPRGGRRGRRAAKKPCRRPVLLASDSGRGGESPSQNPNVFYDVFQQVTGGGSFSRAQREDDRLKHCWSQVCTADGKDMRPKPHPPSPP